MYNTSGQYSTQMFAAKAAEWLQRHAANATAGASPASAAVPPIFLYLAFQAAHSSNNKFVQAPTSYLRRFDNLAPTTCGQYMRPGSGACSFGVSGTSDFLCGCRQGPPPHCRCFAGSTRNRPKSRL